MGEKCAICGALILEGDDVEQLDTGAVAHKVCWFDQVMELEVEARHSWDSAEAEAEVD